ncbi:MAG: Asp23/Gls24 family envelope stress response protein, partial [Firmicutes bacterium]|nr:Asp23/Gls24 family envelope stress response protein [Bacillota bacterium]
MPDQYNEMGRTSIDRRAVAQIAANAIRHWEGGVRLFSEKTDESPTEMPHDVQVGVDNFGELTINMDLAVRYGVPILPATQEARKRVREHIATMTGFR